VFSSSLESSFDPPPLGYSLQPSGVLSDGVASGCLYMVTNSSHVGGGGLTWTAYPTPNTSLWLIAAS
jgi:hypothetical protein